MTVFFALLTMYFSNMRYLTALTAVGLFVASFAESMHWNRTFWHNAIIAIAIFVAAMLDRGPTAARQERELYGRI
jgi:hypothetical protein